MDTTSFLPASQPEQAFLHHSIPAWDESNGPVVELGNTIGSNKFLISHACVLVSKLNPRKSRVSVVRDLHDEFPQCASTEFMVYVPIHEDVDIGFYSWYMKSECFQSELEKVATGTTNSHVRVTPKETLNWKIAYPPLSEQRRIAEILDTIDEAIQKTEALILKLKAMKQGMLHDLLTRGLDKNGKLCDPKAHPEQFKDSPFGLVPVDWDVVNLGVLSTLVTSGSRGWASLYSDQGALFLRIGNLTRDHVNLRLDNVRYVLPPPTAAEGKRTRVGEGDLLISITADLGIIGVIPDGLGDAYVNQHIALVRLDRKNANPYWVANYLAFGGSQKQFYMLNDQGAKAGINLPTVESLLVAVPEVQEQDRIAALIAVHDVRIRTEEHYRDKLKLQKKGLMHDLLTGKVKVKV